MTTSVKAADPASTTSNISRRDELRQLLQERRRELMAVLRDRMNGVRAEHSAHVTEGVLDDEEVSVADVQEDLELALIEMQSETLARIGEALARLEAGFYGRCNACGRDIASSRLRALPFAVRCRDCEARREAARARLRTAEGRGQSRHGSHAPSESAVHPNGW